MIARSAKNTVRLLALNGLLAFGVSLAQAQWTPPTELQAVPVFEDCAKTNGVIGIAFQPTIFRPHGAIFLCPKRALEIDSAHPGASLFFKVHEYGHLALHTRNEAIADGWAAEQLNRSLGGHTTLRATVLYFTDLGNRSAPMYGSGYDRALTIVQSGGIPLQEWPAPLIAYRKSQSQKRARNGSIHLSIHDQIADGVLWIDDQLIGFVSTAKDYLNPPMPALAGQSHRLRLQDVWIAEIVPPNRVIAKGLEASLQFQGANSPVGLIATLRYQGDSLIVSLAK